MGGAVSIWRRALVLLGKAEILETCDVRVRRIGNSRFDTLSIIRLQRPVEHSHPIGLWPTKPSHLFVDRESALQPPNRVAFLPLPAIQDTHLESSIRAL